MLMNKYIAVSGLHRRFILYAAYFVFKYSFTVVVVFSGVQNRVVRKDFKLQGEQMIYSTNNMYNGVFYRQVHDKQKPWNWKCGTNCFTCASAGEPLMYSHIQREFLCMRFWWEYMYLVHKLLIATLGNNVLLWHSAVGNWIWSTRTKTIMFVSVTVKCVHFSFGVV